MNRRMSRQAPSPSQLMQIADRLKRTREALGLKPAELCRATKIAPNTYSQWESATQRPELDKAKLLCDTFGYTLDWIYRGEMGGLPYTITSKLRSGPEREVA